MLRFALAQLNPIVGALNHNLKLALQACEEALENNANVIIFPELFLLGYYPQDLLLQQDFIYNSEKILQQLCFLTKNLELYIIIGNIHQLDKKLYNASFLIYKGNILHIQHKQHLPNYSVFDEKRYFSPGNTKDKIISINNGLGAINISLMICEDIWHHYDSSKLNCADMIICINASPFFISKQKLRLQAIQKHAKPCLYVNMVGGQDELIFDGNSLAVDKNSTYQMEKFNSNIAYIDWNQQQQQWQNNCKNITYINNTQDKESTDIKDTFNALVLATKDYVNKNGFSQVVLGLSGGVDSAIVACIASQALGSSNVHSIMMPSQYTADISLIDAEQLAKNLNVSYEIISISNIFNTFKQQLNLSSINNLPNLKNDVSLENLQARIRANILMTYANKSNALLLTTGNKSELATGYCTLYGDMAGAYAVIKDVLKTQIYKLCEHYNNINDNKIPQRILTRAPSAELKPNQTDQDILPDYNILDKIIIAYVEFKLNQQQISHKYMLDINLVHSIINKIKFNEYKRQQAVLGPKISSCSFGKDWRYPITNKYSFIFPE